MLEFLKDAPLEIEDLFLLEDFQIGYLPGYVAERELAAALHAYPSIARFLKAKCPSVTAFIDGIMAEHAPARDEEELESLCQTAVRSIDDLLVYNKCPELYDAAPFHRWDFAEVVRIASLEGKVVIDAGAGTGRVALEAADPAKWVFAVEPVTRLRRFIAEQAEGLRLGNVFVMDGFLHAIPLPSDFADVLITSHALGWHLEDELTEFERVVGAGGHIIHCPGTADRPSDGATHDLLVSPRWGYDWARYDEADGPKRKYWKQVR
ncbi:MAG: methyltransferase domain-containing protein [Candidatus Brocadiaceae bacterium]|jgi:SAM-dependent methyltransferase